MASSLYRAATSLRLQGEMFNVYDYQSKFRIINKAYWEFFKEPAHASRLNGDLSRCISKIKATQPVLLISVGAAPISSKTLREFSALERKVFKVHFSCDDPWSVQHYSSKAVSSFRYYDLILTPRTSNILDFQRHGCERVEWCPFGYDPELIEKPELQKKNRKTALFVGGADEERASFLQQFVRGGAELSLVGSYWHRFPPLGEHSHGQLPPKEVSTRTREALVNICLTRKSNRDGHVMRSIEIGASAGCLLAERTEEHLQIFGVEGDAALYFDTANEAVEKYWRLFNDDKLRSRLISGISSKISHENFSYESFLQRLLTSASQAPQLRCN